MKQDNGEQRLSKWTQQLRDKLADYEVAPPEGLWEEIEVKAPLSPPRRGRLSWRRWAAAAALAALAVSGGYLLWPEKQGVESVASTAQTTDYRTKETLQTPPLTPPLEGRGRPAPGHGALAAGKAALAAGKATLAEKQGEAFPSLPLDLGRFACKEGEGLGVGSVTSSSTAQTTDQTPKEKLQTPPLTPPLEGRGRHAPEKVAQANHTAQAAAKQTTTLPSHTGSLAFYAMNGGSDLSTSNGVRMADEMARKYHEVYANSSATAARSTEPIYLAGYEEQADHYRPVSFGLTLSYLLTERLALTTGLVYTKLRSDFTQVMRSTLIRREQTLHYAGVPLGLNYRLWSARGFSAYAAASATILFNVNTHVVTEGVTQDMEKDRPQLSLQGGLGVQYDVVPQVGLYVEPGLSYYVDNRSHVQNFFKEKPTSLSLQLGVRVNLGR